MPVIVKDPLYKSIRIRPFVDNEFKVADLEYKQFPDGETYIRFLSEIDDDVYLVLARGYPDQDQNIIRTMLITQTLKDLGAKKVILCMPYFPYSRQDKRFLSGEAISAKIVARALVTSGADVIITVDIHDDKVFTFLGDAFINITTEDLWARFIREKYGLSKVVLIAPDLGRKKLVSLIAEKCGVDYVAFSKVRDLKTGKIIKHDPSDYKKYQAHLQDAEVFVIIDDIIATGGTVANIASRLREDGYGGKVVCLFTHGLFLGNSYDKLIRARVDEIYCTDTVENSFIHPSLIVAPYILRKLNDFMLL